MSGTQKALLALLAVLLVGVFAIAVAGRHDERGDPAGHHGFVDWLGRFGGKSSTVDPASVSADCAQPGGGFAVSGSCTLHVADPGRLRRLVLRGTSAFEVTAPGPGGADFTMTDEVEPSLPPDQSPGQPPAATVTIAVDRATDVRVRCLDAQSCVVLVVAE